MATVLPPLVQRHSPNQSTRHGTPVSLLVWHETAGPYQSSIDWLCNPAANASAHLVVREDGGECTQLVPLGMKAWHADVAFNPRSVGAAGGGHPSCGPDLSGWALFLELLHAEIDRGGYRKAWAKD